MQYSIVKRQNPLNREESKYYASAAYSEEIGVRQLAAEISKGCTLNTADNVAFLESFFDKMPPILKNSNRIRLDNFGIFKLSLSSEGKDKEEDVTANDINAVRVLFTPSAKLKHELADVTYTKK